MVMRLSEQMNTLYFEVDDDGVYSPALISMSSSGLKKSKRWNSMINRLQIPHPNGSGTINPAMLDCLQVNISARK